MGLGDLPEPVRAAAAAPAAAAPAGSGLTLHASKEAAEVGRILEALGKHRNNKLRAARELGISRQGLYKKLDKYGLMPTA